MKDGLVHVIFSNQSSITIARPIFSGVFGSRCGQPAYVGGNNSSIKVDIPRSCCSRSHSISLSVPNAVLHYLNDGHALDDKGELQKYEKTLNSFYRYFIRMTTRTTPFGLFSGVGQGICGKTTDLDIGSYPKHLESQTRHGMDI